MSKSSTLGRMHQIFFGFCLAGFLAGAGHVYGACNGASRDNDVWWDGLGHNSFDLAYRKPFEAPNTTQGSMELHFRTCRGDVDSVKLRIWDGRIHHEKWLDLQPAVEVNDRDLGPTTLWRVSVPIPEYPTILYYFFQINDGSKTVYYIDDEHLHIPGGFGKVVPEWDDQHSFLIVVNDASFRVPEWLEGAIIYHIFPDRFRNGDTGNDPVQGLGFVYERKVRMLAWDEPLCDPRGDSCPEEYANQFYGGDLQGIIHKLDYIKSLGATALYLNPIFQSPSNHGYDITDFFKIDPRFGDLETFRDLVAAANQRGIRLILDGVFNHTSADHPYFDYYSRWNDRGELTSLNGPGVDDGSGACESPSSPYRHWYMIPDRGRPAYSEDWRSLLFCPRTSPNEPWESRQSYESWAGYYTLPKLQTKNEAVRLYFYKNGLRSVAPYWLGQGASGWRLDVAAEIDGGMVSDPQNYYWQEFRIATKGVDPDSAIIGECWDEISPFLLGNQWDSAMNYRLRGMLLNWMFDRCEGLGCSNGQEFQDNDNNPYSFSGPIRAIPESRVVGYAMSRLQTSPTNSRHGVVSLLGSHDTNRLAFLLEKISGGDERLAKLKQKFLVLVLMTTPGAPMIYYGDEVALASEGRWDGRTWQDDPYNRSVYPWADQGLSSDNSMLDFYRQIGAIHNSSTAFKNGQFEIITWDDGKRTIVFRRFQTEGDQYLIALNRNSYDSQTITINLETIAANGTVFTDQLSQRTYMVSEGRLILPNVAPLTGLILKLEAQ